MDSTIQPSNEIKTSASQYENPLTDEDLVVMNEMIQSNLDDWNLDNQPPLQCSQEIKLESYNFLGNRINYEDDKFELDEFSLPENYFKREEDLQEYDSEDEDGERRTNGAINAADEPVAVIDIPDDSSEDDDGGVVSLLNSSGDSLNASSVSIHPNLESIRSDHNYSSQEVYVGTPNQIDVADHTPVVREVGPEAVLAAVSDAEQPNEPIDYVIEMQALIANWMNDATGDGKVTILNDLENEIKRIKSTMLNDSQQSQEMERPSDSGATAVIDLNTSNASEDIENDSYMMSEGHSEPLEYRGGREVLPDSENLSERFDDETAKTLKNLRSVSESIASKVSKLFASDPIPGETVKSDLIDLTNCGRDLVECIKAVAITLKIQIDEKVGSGSTNTENEKIVTEIPERIDDPISDNVYQNQGNEVTENDAENVNGIAVESIDEAADKNVDEIADKIADGKLNDNSDDKSEESTTCGSSAATIDDKVNEDINRKSDDTTAVDVLDKVAETAEVVEDKQQMNLRSKKRWLASSSSSSDDDFDSDESISENVTVKRRKKRARTVSTSDGTSSTTKNRRKKNVLLVSSDSSDERSGKDLSSSGEFEGDVDMSKYLLPSDAPANVSVESETFDDIDDKNEQRVDSEMEEFLGFDAHACDDVNIRSTFNREVVEPCSIEEVTSVGTEPVEPTTTEVIEADTEPTEVSTSETEPMEDIVTETEPSQVAASEPEPVEVTANEAEPVEVTASEAEPVEVTTTETEPIEATATVTQPADDIVNEMEPADDIVSETESAENIVCETEPSTDPKIPYEQSQQWDSPESHQLAESQQFTESQIPYAESQQWDFSDDTDCNPIVLNDLDNDVILDGTLSPKKEIEIDAESEVANDAESEVVNDAENVTENGDGKAEDAEEEKDNEPNNHNEDEESEYDTDDEIDRLVDLSTIPTKCRPIVNYVPVYKKRSVSKPKPKDDILDILKDTTSQDIESESSSEEDIVNEEQFVLQLAKQQCLKYSSDSDAADSDSADNDEGLQSSLDGVTEDDSSNDSKLNRFLKKRLANETATSGNDLHREEKIIETANAHEKQPDEEEDEDDVDELQSSGIFEPEIELHDGEKAQDSDAGEIEEPPKAPEEKKKWKLDKIAFNKNLFKNLDDLDDEKNVKAANSDNSDCEMLDISMFKTKKSAGDLDKIIQNQKKRDVSKISTKVADECISLSSDSDLEIDKGTIDDDSEDDKPTTKSRPMLRNDQLAGETKQAQKEENDRLKRLEKKTERLTQIVESQTQKLKGSVDDSEVILDFDTKQNCAISVHPEIVKNLKEHQIAGVKFMYDCCYGSVDSIEKHSGSGCILAHCMGLGKTLQLIALLHTLIRYPQLKTKKILVICPKSTIMNWADEIQTWLRSVKVKLKVLHFPDQADINKKLQILREWHSFKADPEGRAGCMLIGYEAFRSLVFYTEKPKLELSQIEMDRIKKLVDEYLLKPGADLVVCDEGHVIKNRKSTTSRAVNKISSRRRIILTGTPIQNNLKEYYSMVNFIKPSFLGTEKEFANLYENPIKEGQHKDSNNVQIRIMKQRSYVLHKKLSKFVQRREAALLKTFLPEKYEYVLFIPMTELQNNLYQHFLDNNPLKERCGGKSLIPDYTFLRKIWTHPKVLENAWKNAIALRDKRAAIRRRNMDSDEEPDDVLDNQVGKMSVENDWWRQFIEPQDLRSLLPSNKLRILFEILKLCEQNREKCLIFSAFVAVLDVVEYFMQQIHDKVSFNDLNELGLDKFYGPWQRNSDYFRLDGKTSKAVRHAMIQSFNDPTNERVKCFLISAKAGGQGINLVGANRVILLDTSWNPSNDQQNIFRVFRLGQQRKCYIYRLLAMGTMEEKVYSRSVTKQAMSFRVVDEQQIDRHYSLAELAELYTLTKPDPEAQPTPIRPVDNILANLLRNFKNLVYKYHEHDSLLENNSAEDLNEQEKADAWEAYEKDVSMKNQFGNMNITADGLYGNPYAGFGMSAGTVNPYTYIPQNLPASMIPAYLQRMGYSPGVEQELLLMSQMYNQFSSPGGSSGAYGPLSAMFNSSSAAANPLYSSSSAASNYYKSSNVPSTTSPSSSYASMASNVFNGISQLVNQSSSAAAAASVAHYGNLSRYMPSYSASSSALGSSFPFNLYPTTPSSSTSSNSVASNQPGPNAIKNPLLSNLLPPSTSKDSFSIPTSVITKASKDVPRTNTSMNPVSLSPTSISSNAMGLNHQKSSAHSSHSGSLSSSKGVPLTVARASPLSVARSSPLSSARASPLSSARASPLSTARASPSVKVTVPSTTRSSPSESRSSSTSSMSRASVSAPNSLSISRTSSTMPKSNQIQASHSPLSITLTGNRTSPERNLIVRDAAAINRTLERKAATTTSKAPVQPIKNYNIGIVYPKAPEKKTFDLSQNDSLLKAAQNQMRVDQNRLNPNSGRPHNLPEKNRISIPQSPNRTANRPVMTASNRISNVKGAAPRTTDSSVTSSASSSAKNHLSPNLPTNEVTITPTKRLQRVPLPATNNPIEINKLSNSALSVSRLPSSTSITRTIPTSSANANKIVGRLQNPPKVIPKIIQQGAIPTLKLISQPNNKVAVGGMSRASTATTTTAAGTAINRNQQMTRVVATSNGVPLKMAVRPQQSTADIRKVFTNPPKLANFSNSASESRKRKLEELIPKNTGVTLIKKPKPREPSTSASVEIVELD